jgi:gluconate 2-dehydrogenase alpha chain
MYPTYADGLLALSPYEARTLAAVWDRMFPADEHSPAASAIGAITYLDRTLTGVYAGLREHYRLGLRALDANAMQRFGQPVHACSGEQVDQLIGALQADTLVDFAVPPQAQFFSMIFSHLQEGVFGDPAHGGNRELAGWRFLAHPGVHRVNDEADHLASDQVVKPVQSMADAGWSLGSDRGAPVDVPGYDPQNSVRTPQADLDVIVVGVGAVGSLVAHVLTAAGVRVLGLEAGPWRFGGDFVPDEVGAAYYSRGDMGPKFLAEAPTWRPDADHPTRAAPFSLGRMMNGVGGSVIHWGGALRRQHPHHFAHRSHVLDRWGPRALPEGSQLVDWPVSYDDLEHYYTALEWSIGVAGDREQNPFVKASKPLPLPPVRPFVMGERFIAGARSLGLHPYPTPVALNSRPYNNNPQSTYNSFAGGFGPFDDDRWMPGHNWVPDALATGNLDLKTGCRVIRIITDPSGRACGVEYLDPLGQLHTARAGKVILASYTFENLRLMWLSASDRHPDGLGNDRGMLGKHYMTKHWNDVYGYFPDTVFNAQTGPAAQMVTLDDYASADFDSYRHGFIGGASPNVENQRLPLQISREPLPPDVPDWGKGYKDQLRRWQHLAAVRFQPDAMPYEGHQLDLDPWVRDRSGLGLPVVRITYRVRENEARLTDFMRGECRKILQAMGAADVWNGREFTGIVSSHDLGGARMGVDPTSSVVSPDLAVHDTPGLYVFGGAAFPTMNSANPTLTLWALCYRSAEAMIRELQSPQ